MSGHAAFALSAAKLRHVEAMLLGQGDDLVRERLYLALRDEDRLEGALELLDLCGGLCHT